MKRKRLPRILMTLLGAALILWSAGNLALGLFGERASATVTHIRREGGERAEAVPNRYTYNISYTFLLPDGREIHGVTKQIRDAVYLKADGTGRITVRYAQALPYLNAPEEDTRFGRRTLIVTAAGVFLIVQMNRKHKTVE